MNVMENAWQLPRPLSRDELRFQQLFKLGMKRDLPDLIDYPDGVSLDIGSNGKHKVEGAVSLGPPEWVWPRDPLPYDDGTVTTIHAYHFLEHLNGKDAMAMLREAERVMVPGRSVLNFSVPYYKSNLMAQCLDHQSAWSEETFKNLFEDDSYEHDGLGQWRLRVHFLLIAGIVERNIALIGQLVRDLGPGPA